MPATGNIPLTPPPNASILASWLPPAPDGVDIARQQLERLYHDPVSIYDPNYAGWVQRIAALAAVAGVAVNIVTVNLATDHTDIVTYGAHRD